MKTFFLFTKKKLLFRGITTGAIVCLLVAFCATTTMAQKKVNLVMQSTITGINLPAGSKQDKKLISEVAGKSLLQMEAKNLNATVTSIEILYLPAQSGFTADSLVKALSAGGWSISFIKPDNKYALLKKNNQSVLTYLEITKTDINLYFGEMNNSQPVNNVNNNTVTTNTGGNTNPTAPVKTNNSPVSSNGFQFSTTNFDDGWTSTVQEDWVEVTKGSIKVLLHFPKEGTVFPADPEPLTNAAWNILVAPRYSNLINYKTAYISTYNRPYLGMGYAKENRTGAQKFVVLFRQGESGWIEFICPDKNSFIQEFKLDPETVQWDTNSDLMNPLFKMKAYNKFAIAASDFKGKWTSDFTGIQQLYYVYTGNYAGMNIHQSNEEFVFSGNTYKWKLLAINGMVGNTRYDQAESSGTFSVPNNWQLQCSKIEKGPKTYNAFWSCIKGARVLNLLDAQYPGSGIYTQYGLAK